jgi:cytochrome oxidase Cu insertion factor (SCO1/SenC/PrrC family)
MIGPGFRALLASFLFLAVSSLAVSALAADEADADKPKLTARPQGLLRGELTLTALDEKAAFAFSQAAIGRPLGDFVLLDRDGKPVELSRYLGKPLLVNFIYTACFQVCPTTTRNLQKALENTVSVMGADRFNVISIGFNQPFRLAGRLEGFFPAVRYRSPQLEFSQPGDSDRR